LKDEYSKVMGDDLGEEKEVFNNWKMLKPYLLFKFVFGEQFWIGCLEIS